jgi:hypothetical protein
MSYVQDMLGIQDSGGTFGTGSYQGAYTPQQMQSDLGMVQKAQVAQLDPTQQAQARAAQQGLLAQFQAQASGQGPSLAQMQLQQATDRNAANAMGLIASQRGLNPGLAARLAGQNAANINQQAAGQSAMARLAEQYQAQQGLAGLSGQMRGQDLELAGQNAQLAQQSGQFNASQYNQMLAQAQAAQQQRIQQQNAQIAQMEEQRRQAAAQFGQKVVGGLASAGSGSAGGAAMGGAQNGLLAILPGGV